MSRSPDDAAMMIAGKCRAEPTERREGERRGINPHVLRKWGKPREGERRVSPAIGDYALQEMPKLLARVAELERDAARYRWLCEYQKWPEDVDAAFDCGPKVAIDAAIDAALGANP